MKKNNIGKDFLRLENEIENSLMDNDKITLEDIIYFFVKYINENFERKKGEKNEKD